MMLRIQLERQKQSIFLPCASIPHYCLNRNNIKLAKKDVIVMHPGLLTAVWNIARHRRRSSCS